jgi:uncharacterized protein (DUF433 family)
MRIPPPLPWQGDSPSALRLRHQLLGKPAVKGTRLTVEFIVDLLVQGWTGAGILRNYPGPAREDVQACLGYAGAVLQAEKVYLS